MRSRKVDNPADWTPAAASSFSSKIIYHVMNKVECRFG